MTKRIPRPGTPKYFIYSVFDCLGEEDADALASLFIDHKIIMRSTYRTWKGYCKRDAEQRP